MINGSIECDIAHFRVDGGAVLSPALADALDRELDAFEHESNPSSFVIQVKGAYDPGVWPCAPEAIDPHLVGRWEKLLRRIEKLPVPTAIFVEGACNGVALELLLTVDYRFATAGMTISLPGRHGMTWPSMSLFRLTREVGVAGARRLMLRRAQLTSTDALAIGLLDEVAETENDVVRSVLSTALSGCADIVTARSLILEAPSISNEEALGQYLAACERSARLHKSCGVRHESHD